MSVLVSSAVVLAMFGCLILIPLGLPGLWLIVVMTLGLVLFGALSWPFGLTVAGVALVAEVGEILLMRRFGKAFGGSRAAFWGALVGGMVGLFVGVPVPVVGPMVTALLGSFLGAGLVTLLETMSLERSARVGWGILLARTITIVLKVATGVVVIGSVAVSLLWRS